MAVRLPVRSSWRPPAAALLSAVLAALACAACGGGGGTAATTTTPATLLPTSTSVPPPPDTPDGHAQASLLVAARGMTTYYDENGDSFAGVSRPSLLGALSGARITIVGAATPSGATSTVSVYGADQSGVVAAWSPPTSTCWAILIPGSGLDTGNPAPQIYVESHGVASASCRADTYRGGVPAGSTDSAAGFAALG